MSTPFNLSRVSRDALEALAQWADWLITPDASGPLAVCMARIRAEAAAPEAEPPIWRGDESDWEREPPQPQPRTRAEVDGWKRDCEYTDYIQYTRGNQDVSFDGQELEARETVSGYEGWTATVRIPLALLRELGLRPTPAESPAIAAAERAVLDAFGKIEAAIKWQRKHIGSAAITYREIESIYDEYARRAAARGTEGDRGK